MEEISPLQAAYETAREKRKASHRAEAAFLTLYGWEDLGIQGETTRWWYHETLASNPQESAVRMSMYFFKRDILKSPRCVYCNGLEPDMRLRAGQLPRCVDTEACDRRRSANE
jgi:hypothetical protein